MALTRPVPPTGQMISRGPGTKTLYRLEQERNDAVKAAAKELGKVMGHGSAEFWERTMPEALYATLDSFSPETVRVVCETWLAKNPPPKAGE